MSTSIVQLLDDVGLDDITFQLLGPSITNVTQGKKETKITFATDNGVLSPANVMTGTGKVGLVVWCTREGWERATARMKERKAK